MIGSPVWFKTLRVFGWLNCSTLLRSETAADLPHLTTGAVLAWVVFLETLGRPNHSSRITCLLLDGCTHNTSNSLY
eukprot:5514438-Amphidinium_carterae.1